MKKIVMMMILAVMMAVSTPVWAQNQAYKPMNWTGFYFGVQGSYHTGNSEWDGGYGGNRINHSLTGGMGGFLLGYSFHIPGNIVAGIETEMNFGRVEGSSACPNASYTCHTDMYWVGSTRGRFGYALDRFLPFITIGWAYGGADTYVKYLPTGNEYGRYAGYFGFTPGAGFELAITKNIHFRAEYNYYYFFRSRVEIDYQDTDVQIDHSAFKAGLTFKF